MREAGWYWVLWGRDLEVGHWDDDNGCWWMNGREDKYHDHNFKRIGPKINEPEEM